MIAEGNGGRIGDVTKDVSVLDGLIGVGPKEILPLQQCANTKCGRVYRPRAEGDDFCNERCDPLNKMSKETGSSDDLLRLRADARQEGLQPRGVRRG